jgi:hypothetical protein
MGDWSAIGAELEAQLMEEAKKFGENKQQKRGQSFKEAPWQALPGLVTEAKLTFGDGGRAQLRQRLVGAGRSGCDTEERAQSRLLEASANEKTEGESWQ